MSQVCGVIFEQRLVVGTHDPVQFPAPVQTYMQETSPPQLPFASQVCCVVLSLHCLAPGAQVPVQLPVAHTNMQVWSLPQLPVASQVCAVLLPAPVHRLLLGTHDPLHTPAPMQT
jgi:hypothetical protein